MNPTGVYTARDSAITITNSHTGDVFQLHGGANRVEVIEIRMGQTTLTDLEQLVVTLERGTGGTGGLALTEREWQTAYQAPTAAALSESTAFTQDVDATALDLDYQMTWNILQELVWLPTPEFPLILPPNVNLGIALQAPSATISLNVGIVWREF